MNADALAQCQHELARVKKEFEEFLYLVSHDLNAPIRAIYNLSGWIAEDLGNDIPDEVKQHINLLQNRSQQLEKMLSAILVLSRVPRLDLELEYIALLPFLEKIGAKFRSDLVTINIQANYPGLTTYYQKLQTILDELIINAIKHTDKEKVTINLAVTQTNDFLTFIISDNGPGFTSEVRERIFSLFYTAAGKEGNQNIGAGLTIAKSIATFIGGSLEVTNAPANQGSSFVLQWPINATEKV